MVPHSYSTLVNNMKFIALFSILASCLLVSCQPPADQQVTLNPKHWKLVKKTPPTYYPVDTPNDQKTTHGNGFWVYSGDVQNTQYFIPFNQTNVPNKTLLAEAQSTRTEKLKAKQQGNKLTSKTTELTKKTTKAFGKGIKSIGSVIPFIDNKS